MYAPTLQKGKRVKESRNAFKILLQPFSIKSNVSNILGVVTFYQHRIQQHFIIFQIEFVVARGGLL